MGLLSGTRAVVTGIANKRSMAWGIAKAFDREGAQLILSYQSPRLKENLDKLLSELSQDPLVLPLDVVEENSVDQFIAELSSAYPDGIHTLVHSMAYANREDLEGRFVDTTRDGYMMAQNVSAYSLTALTRGVLPLMEKAGSGSIMTLTYQGSVRVMPNYNVMGVAKAALESSVRYLAYDLGRQHIRVNAISAGPVKTLAASGVRGISAALHDVADKSPIGENITTEDVGNAAVFLASDWAKRITGHVLYVDSGLHMMGFLGG
ncbi:MAG: NADH-specific enoyl-ACP reductase [Sulfobacillus benefaciens]|uniref:Enoyl-[acyl-carrier-protein] reductase [NADH] n=1 Tax=Sulfobacillus benefaciens TaxID=453960 RepID=A0A2T2XK20_9FIRM|nr:MAG: NADH-specific enoyl-ACP reductase [Sulfobacillus benefaciens]